MAPTDKVDVKKSDDTYQARRGAFRVLDVPERRYLMIDGHGDPNTTPAFARALETLYPTAYTLKFFSKRELGRDYVVPPLEGLWWAQDMDAFTRRRDKSQWDWTVMLMVPDWLGRDHVDAAIGEVAAKGKGPRLADLRVETLTEGLCVQTLHVGTFDDEAAVLHEMHTGFIPAHELELSGTHYEIYLSDLRRVEPSRQRTILRQPVSPRPHSTTTP